MPNKNSKSKSIKINEWTTRALGVPVPIADNPRSNSLGDRPVQDIQGGEIKTNQDSKTHTSMYCEMFLDFVVPNT